MGRYGAIGNVILRLLMNNIIFNNGNTTIRKNNIIHSIDGVELKGFSYQK